MFKEIIKIIAPRKEVVTPSAANNLTAKVETPPVPSVSEGSGQKSIGWEEASQQEKTILEEEGKNIQQQTLKGIAAVGYQYVKNCAVELGLEISDFPLEKIQYDSSIGVSGRYNHQRDDISIKLPHLRTIIHEELHYATAIDKRRGAKSPLADRRSSKSGFRSTWEARPQGGEKRDLLRSLNEAVTEKMAQEIFNKNKDNFFKDFRKNFSAVEIAANDLSAKSKKWELEKLAKEGAALYENQKPFSMEDESFEEFLEDKKQRIGARWGGFVLEDQLEKIVTDQGKAYSDEIHILNAILNRLAQKKAQAENIPLADAAMQEWHDLQGAYLTGNSLYLKKIEKNIGLGTLRLFNDIDQRKYRSGQETPEEHKSKIESLLATIQNS